MSTTVTSKGQVTIPKPVRDHLGIGPGSRVDFRRTAEGDILIEKADGPRQPSRFAKARGSAGPVRAGAVPGRFGVNATQPVFARSS